MKRAWMWLAVMAAGCATNGPAPTGGLPMAGDRPDDVIHLANGEEVRGRIVKETPSEVSVERAGRVAVISRGAIYNIEYSKESYVARTAPPLRRAEPVAGSRAPVSSWYPRKDGRERVEQTEILWFDRHPLASCMGPKLSAAIMSAPELTLFAPPGGRLVFHDPRLWGYHAHLFAPSAFHKPVEKPGLEIAIPEAAAELPESVAFVSPAQEMKSGEDPERMSHAVPDTIYAKLAPSAHASAMLASQLFAGGKPAETPNGRLWAFALPRSDQFFVYLYDGEGRHGPLLKTAFAAYGDTILSADAVIDMEGPDGTILGRVLVVPFPDEVSADGPAPEPVTIYAGPTQDPTLVSSVPLPPRHSVQLPPRPPSTRADVFVNYYEVSQDIPAESLIAYGSERPTDEVTIAPRTLTPEDRTRHLEMDLSDLKPERFPAVMWLMVRRTYLWRETGGFLPSAAPVPPLVPAEPIRLVRVKKSDPIPHVMPILFSGPRVPTPGTGPARVDPALNVAGGMADSLFRSALAREAGNVNTTINAPHLSSVPTNGSGPGKTAGKGSLSNTTNVTVVVPPHQSAGAGLLPGASVPPSGIFLSSPNGPSAAGPLRGGGKGIFGPTGTHIQETGIYRDAAGNVVYDPRHPGLWSGSGGEPDGLSSHRLSGIDSFGRVIFSRRTR